MSVYKSIYYQSSRGFVFTVFKHICAMPNCGHKSTECHHVNKIPTDNRPVNLMPLCKSCHDWVHRSNIDLSFYPNLLLHTSNNYLTQLEKCQ